MANAGGPYIVDLGIGVTLNGAASSDPDAACGDSIVVYSWNIGNGAIALSGATPSLPWEQLAGLGVGSHAVQLTVTDEFGATGFVTTSLTVSTNSPVASFIANPNPSACNQNVSFDGSRLIPYAS